MLDLHFCAGKWGLLSIAVHGLLIALAFSCCRAHALGHMGFSDCSSWALEHRFNSFGTQVQLLCGMWYLPGSGIKLVSPALASSLPLSHHGNPCSLHFKSIFHCEIMCVYGMRFWLLLAHRCPTDPILSVEKLNHLALHYFFNLSTSVGHSWVVSFQVLSSAHCSMSPSSWHVILFQLLQIYMKA